MPSNSPDILIRGAGIIGLSIAWTLMRHGVTPKIYDPGVTSGKASWAAAGMISADFEALIEPEFSGQLHALAARSVDLWPEFAQALEAQSGKALHLSAGPTLGLLPQDSLKWLEADRKLRQLEIEPDAQSLEVLVPRLRFGDKRPVLFARDGQVDNRAVLAALEEVCRPCFVECDPGEAGVIIECKGWRTEGVRPVKGQMLSLEPRADHPKIPVRWGAAYIVPKPDRTIIGASVEPDHSGLETDDERLLEMLKVAAEIAPGLQDDQVILEKWAGLRPMARRQRPMIGWQDEGRRYIAAGHYRNGILLAPATAERVVSDILSLDYEGPEDLSDLTPG